MAQSSDKPSVVTGYEKVDQLLNAGDFSRAIDEYSRARDGDKPESKTRSKRGIQAEIGFAYHRAGDYKNALLFFESAMSAANDTRDAQRDINSFLEIRLNAAILLCVRGNEEDIIKAEKILRESIAAIPDGDEFREHRMHFHGHHGNINTMLGAHASGGNNLRIAIRLARELRNRREEGVWTGNLGMNQLNAESPESAETCFQEALLIAKEIGDAENQPRWVEGLKSAKEMISSTKTNGNDSDIDPLTRPSAIIFNGLAPRVSITEGIPAKIDLVRQEQPYIDATLGEALHSRDASEVFGIIDCVKSLVGRELMFKKRLRVKTGINADAVLHGLRPHQILESIAREPDRCVLQFYYTNAYEFYVLIGYVNNGVPVVDKVKVASRLIGYSIHRRLLNFLEKRKIDPLDSGEDCYLPVLAEFGNAILPRLAHIKGLRRILLLPYKLLYLVPLHAMSWKDGQEFEVLDEVGCVTYGSSLLSHDGNRMRLSLWDEPSTPKTERILFAYIDSRVGGANTVEAAGYRATFESAQGDVREAIRVVTDGSEIPRDLGSYAVLSWSSHAFSDPTDWGSSYLAAGKTKITAAEIINSWELKRTFVSILSACETGCDKSIDHAVDEYFGLDLALNIAGSGSVISTMWPIEETLAGMTTTLLFQGILLRKISPSECLRQTRHELVSGMWRDTIEESLRNRAESAHGRPLSAAEREFVDRVLSIRRDAFNSLSDWAAYRCFGAW